MTIRLRTATIDDAPLLTELGERLFAQTFGPDNTAEDMSAYLADAFNTQRQAAELAEPGRITWIAEDATGTAIGYAVLIRGGSSDMVDASRPAELRRIYVDQTMHGRELPPDARRPGALLLDQCVSQAHDWGCDVLWLAVWEKNPRAIRFYEKNGFRQVGRTTFQLGTDIQHDFVMARNL